MNITLIHSIAHRLGVQQQEYDDCIQEGMIAVWLAAKTYDPDKAQFGTYAYIKARGAMLDYLKRYDNTRRVIRLSQAERDISEYEWIPDKSNPLIPELHIALSKLPRRDKELIDLMYWRGCAGVQAAKLMGISAFRLSTWHQRIIRKLREELI